MLPGLRERLTYEIGGREVYRAGLPCATNVDGYLQNFSRDILLAGMIGQDAALLRSQLEYSAARQALAADPRTGAEPGKIHHQDPAIEIRGLSTLYNACDTTALFILAHQKFEQLTGNQGLSREQRPNIERALAYIFCHLTPNYFFEESPRFSGADRFALKVTDWRDSVLPQRSGGEPVYPVIFALTQAQNAAGVRAAGELLGSRELSQVGDLMVATLQRMYNPRFGMFDLAWDAKGPILATASDSLQTLFYLRPDDLTDFQLKEIIRGSAVLETPAGFRAMCPEHANGITDRYHIDTIWPWEQAAINAGLRKNANRPAVRREVIYGLEVSSRIMTFIDGNDAEAFQVMSDGSIVKIGCDPQTWTVETRDYFNNNPALPRRALAA